MMALITSYNPLPISFTHGKGVWLYAPDGTAYLDSFSGIAVCGLGHAHPAVTKTIQEQAAKLLHTSNAFHIESQERLAEKLTQMSGMEQVFFANSGAEVNEAAIKLARLFGHQKGIETPSIIVMNKAFHGRTLATLSASGSRKVQAGFEPLVSGFVRAPFNDFQAIQTIANNREDVVAVMLEPIQGEGGILVADDQYLTELAGLCQKQGWLLILDEIQTGNARTGHYFACMGANVRPDIITTAKGLGNGMPIGACLMQNNACNLFKPGNHGSTFGGNPLACATALTVMQVIEQDGLCEKVVKGSALLREKLQHALGDCSQVVGLRGKGYMLGLELDKPASDLRLIGLKHQILLNVTAENVVRIMPPLIISEQEIDLLVQRLTQSIHEFYQ